jgi:hypothetical protein
MYYRVVTLRENIQIYYLLNIDDYLKILEREHQALPHPSVPRSFVIGFLEVPFYRPETVNDHVTILGFNYTPLPFLLIQVLIDNPTLIPDHTLIRWTQEQELILEKQLRELREQERRGGHSL